MCAWRIFMKTKWSNAWKSSSSYVTVHKPEVTLKAVCQLHLTAQAACSWQYQKSSFVTLRSLGPLQVPNMHDFI